jgi:leucyl aminopeptidase
MISTKLTLSSKKPEIFRGDLLVFCMQQNKKGKLVPAQAMASQALDNAINFGDFKGDVNERLLVYTSENCKTKENGKRILYIGIGKTHDKNNNELRELCRNIGGTIASQAKEIKAGSLHITPPVINSMKGVETAECLVEGILLGDYSFLKYKKENRKKPVFKGIKKLVIYAAKATKGLRKSVRMAQASANAGSVARNMANEPGNGWTPTDFANYATELAGRHKMICTVLGKSQMKRLKMGGILGVNQGSSEPPKMVILEYRSSNKNAQTVLIVGKGLTFDSGGVSLKPSAGMEDMKYDMCGGAAALSAMAVVGEEKPDVNVVAIIPSTDNMSGSSALKPGDIIRHYSGVTAEIVNTDAEGRLILADALAYGIKKFKPTCVVDLATLTGAVIFGLGHHRTGLLGNNQPLVERVLAAGDRCGEPLWQLPLDKEYSKQIDSDVADIKNTGGRPAGTITAAAYLQKFVGETPWTHLDIAGTAWDFTKKSYIPKGPSGTGVRTLVELLRNWEKFSQA